MNYQKIINICMDDKNDSQDNDNNNIIRNIKPGRYNDSVALSIFDRYYNKSVIIILFCSISLINLIMTCWI